MHSNQEIADIFELLSKIMDIHGENSFKTKSYSVAAFKIEKLPMNISTLSDTELQNIPGIGDAISKKIQEIVQTGHLSLLDKYLAETPPGVIDLLKLKGLGPKKIRLIWTELGVESLGELEYACNENRLVSIKGFGAKTQKAILEQIHFIQNNQGFFLFAEAEKLVEAFQQQLKIHFPNNAIHIVGDYLRQMPVLQSVDFITDIDFEDLALFAQQFSDAAVQQDSNTLQINIPQLPKLNFILEDAANKTAQLFTLSNSDTFNNAFNLNYKIPSSASTEQEIFAINQLPYIPPFLRDRTDVFELAKENKIPNALQLADIKGIIHAHSNWSDGEATLEEMALAVKQRGYEYLAISDHSQAAFYANGLTPERVLAQQKEIDSLNNQIADFHIFKSIESDILNDGSLNYEPEILQTFDLVIASVHSNLKMDEEKAMKRVITAIENPFTTILGHPTGRLLLSRAGYPLDFKKVIDACVANKVIIEINAHPRRLDLDWTHIAYALEKGAILSINPDAHSTSGIDLIKYGVLAAQKGGLTKEQNFSSWSTIEVKEYLANLGK